MQIRNALLPVALAIGLLTAGAAIAQTSGSWRVVARASSTAWPPGARIEEKRVRQPYGLAIKVFALPRRLLRADWTVWCEPTPGHPPYAIKRGTYRWRQGSSALFHRLPMAVRTAPICTVWASVTHDGLDVTGPIRLQLLKR
jgi:hypothetical protein